MALDSFYSRRYGSLYSKLFSKIQMLQPVNAVEYTETSRQQNYVNIDMIPALQNVLFLSFVHHLMQWLN
jgi:hypothetical protein